MARSDQTRGGEFRGGDRRNGSCHKKLCKWLLGEGFGGIGNNGEAGEGRLFGNKGKSANHKPFIDSLLANGASWGKKAKTRWG